MSGFPPASNDLLWDEYVFTFELFPHRFSPQSYSLYFGEPMPPVLPLPTVTRKTRVFSADGNGSQVGVVKGTGPCPKIAVREAFGHSHEVTVLSKDVPGLAAALFEATDLLPSVRFAAPHAEAPAHYRVGTGSTEARVNVPTNDQQAERNLHFALANLRAYVLWNDGAEERKAKEQAAISAGREALALYNLVHNTSYLNWSLIGGNSIRDAWTSQLAAMRTKPRLVNIPKGF